MAHEDEKASKRSEVSRNIVPFLQQLQVAWLEKQSTSQRELPQVEELSNPGGSTCFLSNTRGCLPSCRIAKRVVFHLIDPGSRTVDSLACPCRPYGEARDCEQEEA